ncbi:hypothetical protein L1887_20811 [Cichorium endivia]|nr:hypothetical protein L1887_20811 [Cichorium endivia]
MTNPVLSSHSFHFSHSHGEESLHMDPYLSSSKFHTFIQDNNIKQVSHIYTEFQQQSVVKWCEFADSTKTITYISSPVHR